MKKFIVAALAFAPALAMAQELGRVETLLQSIGRLIDIALPIVIAIALLAFFWGLVKFIFSTDKSEGTQLMIWGVVALFVMVSVWGLVNFIGESLGVDQTDSIVVPTVPGVGR